MYLDRPPFVVNTTFCGSTNNEEILEYSLEGLIRSADGTINEAIAIGVFGSTSYFLRFDELEFCDGPGSDPLEVDSDALL